jgi:hypothetical protein
VSAVLLFHGPGRRWPLLSGLLLGLSFACRFQDAFFGPVLLGWGLWRRRFAACAWMSAGAAVAVTLQGLVDLYTWGSFLHSPFRYLSWNVFEDAARRYGVEPPWFYLPFLVAVLVLVPPFLKSGLSALENGGRRFPLLLAAPAFYLLLHSLVVHKAFRFVLPAIALLSVPYAFALFDEDRLLARPFRNAHRVAFVGLHLAALLVVSFWYPQRGPIQAALALSRKPDFVDRLVVVDGEESSVGGHYYLRRPRVEVLLVPRTSLFSWLRANSPETPLYVLAVREPLGGFEPPPAYELEPAGEFRNWPDWQANARRFLYRLVERR